MSIFLCAGVLSAPAGFAAEKYDVTASEIFNPFGILPGVPVVGQVLYPDTVKCPGYEPTGFPEQPCPVGSRTHLRNAVIVSQVYSADDRVAGWMTIVLKTSSYPSLPHHSPTLAKSRAALLIPTSDTEHK